MKQNLFKKICRQTLIVTSLLLTFFNVVNAQQSVGIGTKTPDGAAALDITSPNNNKGVMLTRVNLTDRHDAVTIPNPPFGMVTLNFSDDIQAFPYGKGLYIQLGDQQKGEVDWQKVVNEDIIANLSPSTSGWFITGNSNIDESKNFLGTQQAVDVVVKTNSKEAMRIDKNQNVSIGNNNGGIPEAKLDVDGSVIVGHDGSVINNIIRATGNVEYPIQISSGDFFDTFIPVPKVKEGGTVHVSPLTSLLDGIAVAFARVSGNGIVQIRLINVTDKVVKTQDEGIGQGGLTAFSIVVIQ